MIAQRERWKQKIKQTRKVVCNLPFVKTELDKCPFKYKILTQKYRDICVDIHTRSFIQENGVSQALGLDINNCDHFHDCAMISENRIDHAILTGFSFVLVHKKTNQVLHIAIIYDEFDLPPPISTSKFRSKAVKLRNSLLHHFEDNDYWICQMRRTLKDRSNINISNIDVTDMNINGFGEIRYGAYGAHNPSVDKSFILTPFMVNIVRHIEGLCMYKLGYKYNYGITAHLSTLLYGLAIDNVVNDINNYKNVNYNCQGYAKTTSIWNFSKYKPFVEYVRTDNCNNINNININIAIDDKLCWISCLIDNFEIIRNNGWGLEEYWNWRMYKILKPMGKEFMRLKQNFKRELETEKMVRKKQKQMNIVSKL